MAKDVREAVAVAQLTLIEPLELSSPRVAPDLRAWMGLLDPALPLSELTIPGSLNAGATHGGRWVSCQHHAIAEQLAMGIRFLDIRVRAHRGGLGIFHGAHHQRLDLDDVLTTCASFLRANPTESVLVCLNQEGGRLGAADLSRRWAPYRARFRNLLTEAGHAPTLAQARGRIIVVTRDPAFTGLDHGSFVVQDDWHIPGPRVWAARKWPAISDQLRRARAAKGDGRMWSCFTSSTGWALPPIPAAKLAHRHLRQHFCELAPTVGERNGVVLVDFAEPDLVSMLAGRNHGVGV